LEPIKEHSQLFRSLFDSGSGGCVRECVCGRTFFDNSDENDWTWEEGELERFQQLAKDKPDKCIPVNGAIGTIAIMDIEIVYECPCNASLQYEEFINRHEKQIAKYLNSKAKELEKKASDIKINA
jgi:hypothetical protein